WDYLSKRANSK
ncbi:unnamed protein product, partial [Allacma fusca]